MAKPSKKGRKNHKIRSLFCIFGGCFGISNKVSDGKSVKKVSGRHGRALPVKIPMPTTKEILVIKDEKKKSQIIAPIEDELRSTNYYKNQDISSGKNKNKEKSNSILTGQITRVEKQNSAYLEKSGNPTKLSHSVSLPPPRQKPVAANGGEKGKTRREAKVGGQIDPIVGAVIIMVTLIVMLIWGKMCAILCTAVWFYFLPHFTSRMDIHRPIKLKTGNDLDLDSWEYKKNVVLRGLLDRN